MIYLKLFLTFLEIGAVSFGGGYGMISLIRDKVLLNNWLTEEEFLNLVAVSEATPGPIAVNMATFVGSTQGGVFGSLCATLGAIIPSFILVLTIIVLIRNFLRYAGVNAFLNGVKPVVVGLISATALNLMLKNLIGVDALYQPLDTDYVGILIFVLIIAVCKVYKKVKKKKISPILIILISAGIGIVEGLIKEQMI